MANKKKILSLFFCSLGKRKVLFTMPQALEKKKNCQS